ETASVDAAHPALAFDGRRRFDISLSAANFHPADLLAGEAAQEAGARALRSGVRMSKSVKETIRGMMYHGPSDMIRDSIARKPREMSVSRAYHSAETQLGYYPIHLDIESTSICNLDCPMCPYPEMRIKKGNMTFDLFKNIID